MAVEGAVGEVVAEVVAVAAEEDTVMALSSVTRVTSSVLSVTRTDTMQIGVRVKKRRRRKLIMLGQWSMNQLYCLQKQQYWECLSRQFQSSCCRTSIRQNRRKTIRLSCI